MRAYADLSEGNVTIAEKRNSNTKRIRDRERIEMNSKAKDSIKETNNQNLTNNI